MDLKQELQKIEEQKKELEELQSKEMVELQKIATLTKEEAKRL